MGAEGRWGGADIIVFRCIGAAFLDKDFVPRCFFKLRIFSF